MSANKEHEQYERLETAKQTARQITADADTIEDQLAPLLSGFGKKARASLRKIAYRANGLEVPQGPAPLTQSSRGTWGEIRKIGGKKRAVAICMTREECVARGKIPGPGNN